MRTGERIRNIILNLMFTRAISPDDGDSKLQNAYTEKNLKKKTFRLVRISIIF